MTRARPSTVKEVRDWLATMPDDGFVYSYRGDVTGMVVRSNAGDVISYLAAADTDLMPESLTAIRTRTEPCPSCGYLTVKEAGDE